jgi:hypothetical protein
MPSGISIQVIRAAWIGLVPLGMWICGFLLVVFLGKAEKHMLIKMLLWSSPFFLIPTAWAVYLMVILSRNPP